MNELIDFYSFTSLSNDYKLLKLLLFFPKSMALYIVFCNLWDSGNIVNLTQSSLFEPSSKAFLKLKKLFLVPKPSSTETVLQC